MSMYTWIIYVTALVFAGSNLATAEKCADIDSLACEMMEAQKSDLCQDHDLAQSACPRHCKLCPIECYQCNMASIDDQCNTTMLCATGEVCMRKELVSFNDGHREYQLSCETPRHCDGTGLAVSFGKRAVESRDVSVTCCQSDLCNDVVKVATTPTTTLPPTTTTVTPPCTKDVIVVVDDTRVGFSGGNGVKQFLLDIASGVEVGNNDVLMSLTTFTNTSTTLWDLTRYTDKSSLENAISNARLMRHAPNRADLDAALKYLLRPESSKGERQNADDVVIIVTSHGIQKTFFEQYLVRQVQSAYPNIIVVGITSDSQTTQGLRIVATDAGHEFVVPYAQSLSTISQNVLSLICP